MFFAKDYKMIQNKQKWLFGVTFFILLISSVIVIMNVSSKKKRDLPPNREQSLPANVESNPSAAIETGNSVNQDVHKAAGERTTKKAGETEDRLFNKLVEIDVAEAADEMDDDLENLDDLLESDREINKKFDLPEDILSKTSTDKLFLHYTQSPIKIYLSLYSEDKIGVQRLINASTTVHEFYMRKDLAEGAIKMYREYDFSPQSMSDESIIKEFSQDKRVLEVPEIRKSLEPNNIVNAKIANICMSIYYADRTLLTPQFFPKLKGYEKEFLAVMLERYEKVSKFQEIYGEDRYGAAVASVPRFCLMLAQNIDKDFYNKLKDSDPDETVNKQFFEEIKLYLKN